MTDTYTPNKSLALQATGSNNNSWGSDLNNNVFTPVDTAFGGKSTISVTGIAAGTYVLTIAQYTPPNIVFGGTLGGNLVYSLPTGVGGLWSVWNSTTGAFTLTFASGGGGSLVIPQGQRVYLVCDGANVQYAQTGGAVSANPSALVSTSAVNGTAATFMTSDSAPAIDQTMAPVWTGIHSFDAHVAFGSTVSINYYCSLVGAGTQFDATGGQMLVATQTPGDNSTKAASTAFVAALGALKANLAGPTFTGVPAAPTAALGTTTTQLATTAFATGTGSLATNGYWVFPSGLTIQWGIYAVSSGGTSVPMNITFSNAIFAVLCGAQGQNATTYTGAASTSHVTMYNSANGFVTWFAMGN